MRGEVDPQSAMFSYVSPDTRVPAEHPLRAIKAYADAALKAISRQFDELYGSTGRPSIPPEQLDYNLLFRWFLDMSLDEKGLDQSNFSRLRSRLVETDVALRFFEQVLRLARSHKLLSTEHFTVDSTLIESWAGSRASGRRMARRRRTAGTAPG